MTITIPFWGIIALIIVVCIIVCGILAYFGEKEGGYLGGIGHAIGILIVGFCTIAICLGMIAGKYLF
jgi:hypothetical protein